MSLPDDLATAREILKDFETTADHAQRAALLTRAIEIFDDHLIDDPHSTHAAWIRNTRLSYARRLVRDIANAGHVGEIEWFHYSVLLALRLKPELEFALAEQPEGIRTAYERFRESHREALRQAARDGGYL